MNRRVAISETVKDPSLPPEARIKLELAIAARKFAEENLGLKATNNYTSFVQLDGDYVSYIVTAAPAYDLKPHLWTFPFTGAVPYKGYATKAEAIEEAKEFNPQEFDTHIRGVSAYSTLGWFDDPILSSMLKYRDYSLVNLIIHETVHATLYIEDNADFNERIATFIGNVGAEAYYLKTEGPQSKTLKEVRLANEDEKLFSEFISEEVKNLNTWYKQHANEMSPEKKSQRLAEIKERFLKTVKPQLKIYNYDYFIKQKLNNAFLLSLKTYVFDQTDFEKAYEKLNKSFPALVEFAVSLEKVPEPEKHLKQFANDASTVHGQQF